MSKKWEYERHMGMGYSSGNLLPVTEKPSVLSKIFNVVNI